MTAPHSLHYEGNDPDHKQTVSEIQDSAHAVKRGTLTGRIVRKLPLIGDIVKSLDKVSGDTTYGK